MNPEMIEPSEKTQSPLTFGEPEFKACSGCGQAIKIIPLLSGHSVGATLWSDGYMLAPNLPEQDLLGKCQHCKEIVCLSELEETQLESGVDPESVLEVDSLELDDYQQLLENLEHIDESFHLYLHMKCWHKFNDKRRSSEESIPLDEEERALLERFIPMLGDSEAEQLLKAEAFRQIGEFERAKGILSNPFQPNIKDVVMAVKRLAGEENSDLVVIYDNSVEAAKSFKGGCSK